MTPKGQIVRVGNGAILAADLGNTKFSASAAALGSQIMCSTCSRSVSGWYSFAVLQPERHSGRVKLHSLGFKRSDVIKPVLSWKSWPPASGRPSWRYRFNGWTNSRAAREY